MNIVDESIKISHQLFPYSYENKKQGQVFHFAFVFKKNKLLAIGQNDPNTLSHTALKFAKRFKTKQIHYFKHAEIDAFSKLWGRQMITPDMKLVVIRLNAYGKLQSSKPCQHCSKVIEGLGIKRIYWSTKDGAIAQNF